MATGKQHQHFLTDKHIIVAGAGVSGLSFAISLHKLWPEVSSSPPPRITIYERDPCAVPKNREGYSLSLRSDRPSAGIQTLQKMGVLDKMISVSVAAGGENVAKEEEGAFCVWNVEHGKWKPVMKLAAHTPPGCPVSSLRIARAELRTALVEAVEQLPGVEIKWNVSVTGICSTSQQTQQIHVQLSNDTQGAGDILLAADGSNSKLRTQLRPSDTLKFVGATCITGIAPTKGYHPSNNPNEFGSIISGTGYGLFIAAIDKDTMLWSLSYKVPSAPQIPQKQPLDPQECKALLDEARQKAENVYGPQFSKLLDATQVHRVARLNAMDKQPFLHTTGYIQAPTFQHLEGRIIFLGDANHAVSPFAGNGANLALMDSWDVAEAMVRCGGLDDAVRRYDGLAVGRAKRVIRMSHFTIDVMHATGWWLWFYMLVLRVVRALLFRGTD